MSTIDLTKLLVPVIFANGMDDDLTGLIAAFMDQPFLFADKVYQPGEKLLIERKALMLSCFGLFVCNKGDTVPPLPGGTVVCVRPIPARECVLMGCNITFNHRPIG